MIYLRLFLAFLEIGAVSFGGGYAMIPLVREKVLANAWLSEEAFIDLIAVSESTPGPLAVNMATFVGASQGGFFGSLLATIGVVLPSFVVILLIAALLRELLRCRGVEAFLQGVRPCVVALILAAAATLGLDTLLGLSHVGDAVTADWRTFAVLAALLAVRLGWKRLRGKAPAPVAMIALSALMGIVFFY